MKQTANRIGLTIILALLNIGMAWADSRNAWNDIYWFSSSTSSLLNRSSVELAKNRITHGIRFAYQALAENLGPMDELIAYHNLCIGYLAADKPEDASRFCTRTFELARGPYSVVKIRGTLHLQEITTVNDTMQKTSSPVLVIVSNIQQQDAEVRLGLLMKADIPVKTEID